MAGRYGYRQLIKYTLSLMNVKVLYERITLNGFTTCYTLATVLSCIFLVALQALTYVDNTQAIDRFSPILRGPNIPSGIPIKLGDTMLHICPSLYANTAESCRLVVDFTKNAQRQVAVPGSLPESCVISLMYLDDIVHDARREDVVTFVFQFWMFGVSLFAIIAQSIPHLSAAFFGHLLGTIWAAYRLGSTSSMKTFYQKNVVPKACGGVDLVGTWWNSRISHDIAITVLNTFVLLVVSFLSFKLYNVYTTRTLTRVAASPQVHSTYKLFLFFSAALQLSVFYALASTGMWIDKVDHAPLKDLASHSKLYLAGFIVTLIFQVPWLLLGWSTIRHEGRKLFLAFLGISGGLLVLFTVIFFSDVYLYTFMSWPFFASMTMISYGLLVVTTILAVICRLRFGQGLAEFLNANEELEAADFTPVGFHASARSPPVVINTQVDTYSISDVEKSSAPAEMSQWNIPQDISFEFPTTARFPSQVDTGADIPLSWAGTQQADAAPVLSRSSSSRNSKATTNLAPLSPAPSTIASKRLKSKWSVSTADDLARRSMFTTSSSGRNSVKTTITTSTNATEKVPELPKLEISEFGSIKDADRESFGTRYRNIEKEMEGDMVPTPDGENVGPAISPVKAVYKARVVGDPF